MRHSRWLSLFVSASLVVVHPVYGQMLGKPAPAFTLESLDGITESLADYLGRPVLINFWASWCTPCRTEMPLIISEYRSHQREQLVVLAINLADQERSTKDIRKFTTEFQLPFPVLLDKKGKIRRLYSLRGVPTSIFVGSNGIVRSINPGPIDEHALTQQLSGILPQH